MSSKTAKQAYETASMRVTNLLERLHLTLRRHATAQAASPKDWGYAGDLEHVEEVLKDLLSSMEHEPAEPKRRLNKQDREAIISCLAEFEVSTLFSEGIDEYYVRHGLHIVGLERLTDAELAREFIDALGDDLDDVDTTTEKLLKAARKVLGVVP